MQTLTEIKTLLAERGLRPKHRLGQNFLHDKNQLTKLVDAAAIKPGELVLEVGPGTGTLTEELLERGAQVIACELDPDLAGIIEERLGDRITLIRGDCLDKQRQLNPQIVEAIEGRAFKLVSNLPYQAASPLMTTLLIDWPAVVQSAGEASGCVGQFVTIQKEVADRLLARPGTKQYGPLTIIVQAFAEVRKIATLSPGCFWPPPEVTSAMVAILPIAAGDAVGADRGERSSRNSFLSAAASLAPAHRREFARFITELFTKRRKQLGTIFGRDATVWPEGVSPDLRPEALSVEQLLALWRSQRH